MSSDVRTTINKLLKENEIFRALDALDESTTIITKSKTTRKGVLASSSEIESFVELLLRVIEVVQYHKQSTAKI